MNEKTGASTLSESGKREMKTSLVPILATITVAAGCTSLREQQRLAERERLKREILAELRAEPGAAPTYQSPAPLTTSGPPVAEKCPPSESPEPRPASVAAATTSEPVLPVASTGGVEGRLRWGGEGLASARVRLVRMDTFRSKRAADYRVSEYYDAQTDAEGRYRFLAVEPGAYKLLWVPPSADFWVRRIADRPDVTVKEGRTGLIKEIETKRRFLGD